MQAPFVSFLVPWRWADRIDRESWILALKEPVASLASVSTGSDVLVLVFRGGDGHLFRCVWSSWELDESDEGAKV